jgi:hypothetical protein
VAAIDARATTGHHVVAFRGTTKNGADILRDMRCFPWWHHRVGICPAGFLKGTQTVIDRLIFDTADYAKAGALIFVGHSLGGSEALIAAAWFAALGHPPAAVVAFDPACAGLWKLRRLIKQVPYSRIYWNVFDPVPTVPLFYRHPAEVIRIGKSIGSLDPFVYHRIANIVDSVKAYEAKSSPAP